MLDFKSSSQRKWIGTGVLLMVFSVFFAYRAMETRVNGVLTFHDAKISALGAVGSPVIVFEAGIHTTGCEASRCAYLHWREDVGKIAKIGLDEKRRVSSISIDGSERLSPTEIRARSANALKIAGLLVSIGAAMCARGLVVTRRKHRPGD